MIKMESLIMLGKIVGKMKRSVVKPDDLDLRLAEVEGESIRLRKLRDIRILEQKHEYLRSLLEVGGKNMGKNVDEKLGNCVDWSLFDEFIAMLKGIVEGELGDGEGWVVAEPKVEQFTGKDKVELVMHLFRFGGTHYSVEDRGDKCVNILCHVSVAIPVGGAK
jgi:hypothetical protein